MKQPVFENIIRIDSQTGEWEVPVRKAKNRNDAIDAAKNKKSYMREYSCCLPRLVLIDEEYVRQKGVWTFVWIAE